jgi:hypothetical protein
VRYPHHFSQYPQLSRFSTPQSDPLELDALDFGIPEEELPLPPLEDSEFISESGKEILNKAWERIQRGDTWAMK